MQKSRLIVTETGESVRNDFEIMCYSQHFSLCFLSGKQRNKIVVQMVEEEIHVTITDQSWWEWLKEGFKNNWSKALPVVLVVAGVLAITFGGPVGAAAGIGLICVARIMEVWEQASIGDPRGNEKPAL